MTLSDSDIGSKNLVTWDIGIFKDRQGTGELLSDRNMRHWRFLSSTCDVRTPRQGPLPGYVYCRLPQPHPVQSCRTSYVYIYIAASVDHDWFCSTNFPVRRLPCSGQERSRAKRTGQTQQVKWHIFHNQCTFTIQDYIHLFFHES